MTTTSQTASDLREELGQDTAHLAETLKGRAMQSAETFKNKALDVTESATGAIEAAADKLRDNPDAPDWMASGLQKIARQIEQLASDLQGRSMDDMGRQASRLARDNPGTFLAASAAAGFAATRLLRAGAEHKHNTEVGNVQSGQGQMQSNSYGTDETPVWPGDQNVMPSSTGGSDFAPAYAPEGGVIR